jgi:NAD(P)-dependent dehydrogenase (short-subunit alcohol dehydrogenase family)
MTTRPRIVTGFGHDSTAAEVSDGIDLTGRRAVVTGGASGIGVETARALAAAGAEVTIAARDVAAGEAVAKEIGASTGRDVAVRHLDLSQRATVEAFAAAWSGPLHLLVNNAGVMASPQSYTAEGWELQFGTNHMGHFILTTALHDALAAAGSARVVSLTSVGHVRSPVVFEDIQFRERAYDPWLAYGQSKTANALFAVEGSRRWAGDGITVNAVHPGGIWTNLVRHIEPAQLAEMRATADPSMKTVEQGASTSVLVATSPLLEGIGGLYFEDCNQAVPYIEGGPRRGVASWATDPEAAERLWNVSLDLLA